MDANEAIDILRSKEDIQIMGHRTVARDMAAQALEAWEWVAKAEEMPYADDNGYKIVRVYGDDGPSIIGHGTTPLAAVLDAMRKEKGNG